MKKNIHYIMLGSVILFAGCNDFLDKMPDDRATVNSAEKVTSLLVSAYSQSNAIIIQEMASDNAMDNGSTYTIEDKLQEDAYLWKSVSTVSSDSPKSLWDQCYLAAASANKALEAIDEMGNPSSMSAQRGEALVCRAWAHFQLANVFCLAYNPLTADTDLGLPYADESETEVNPTYERGTLAELYANIQKDLEAGLPLIDDALYSVPKYHFNRKAAYAFAARFYLYSQQWQKCIEAADVVLGTNPSGMMRDWKGIYNMASDYESRCNRYINASEPANLLLQTAYSSMVYYIGPYGLGRRYGHNISKIAEVETYRAGYYGPWGGTHGLYMANSCWGMEQKLSISKYFGYFNYTDKVNGIGYRMNCIVALSANETILCRAEAKAMLGQYEASVEDYNIWLGANSIKGNQTTQDELVKNYYEMPYMGPVVASEDGSPKKPLHPLGFVLADSIQENLVHAILHARRCETIQEGHRWMDIKRWGIEIAHNRDGQLPDVLKVNDPRRAVQIPDDVISAGLEANPRN